MFLHVIFTENTIVKYDKTVMERRTMKAHMYFHNTEHLMSKLQLMSQANRQYLNSHKNMKLKHFDIIATLGLVGWPVVVNIRINAIQILPHSAQRRDP